MCKRKCCRVRGRRMTGRSNFTALDNPMPIQCCKKSTEIDSERFPHCLYHHASPNTELHTAEQQTNDKRHIMTQHAKVSDDFRAHSWSTNNITYVRQKELDINVCHAKKYHLEDAFHTLIAEDANNDPYSLWNPLGLQDANQEILLFAVSLRDIPTSRRSSTLNCIKTCRLLTKQVWRNIM